jgi:hypothetical protein
MAGFWKASDVGVYVATVGGAGTREMGRCRSTSYDLFPLSPADIPSLIVPK